MTHTFDAPAALGQPFSPRLEERGFAPTMDYYIP